MCRLTYSANAGVAVQLAGKRIWVDAVYAGWVRGFSSMDRALFEQVLRHPDFAAPDYLLFTHDHPDHFSRARTEEVMERWPSAKVIMPGCPVAGGTAVCRPEEAFCEGELTIRFIRLRHQGAGYETAEHYGIVLSGEGETVLFLGDSAVAEHPLRCAVKGLGEISAAVLTFPWITTVSGRKLLERHLRARQLLICHLPCAQEDVYGYRPAAFDAAEAVPWPVTVLSRPFQQVTV